MPYDSNADLPPSVRHALPDHAQDIYRAAFNHAWSAEGQHDLQGEARFHRIAWGAVKRCYQKHGGRWVARPDYREP